MYPAVMYIYICVYVGADCTSSLVLSFFGKKEAASATVFFCMQLSWLHNMYGEQAGHSGMILDDRQVWVVEKWLVEYVCYIHPQQLPVSAGSPNCD